MTLTIRAMTVEDYPVVLALWQRTEGIGLNESDAEEAVAAFLRRNPGASAVALSASDELVGAVLCGHDGRRGYLHHLAVTPGERKRGTGTRLVEWCLQRLVAEGIHKCNVFVYRDNHDGAAFWEGRGWKPRDDLGVIQVQLRRG
jgi:putative acetyltransferase